MGFPVSRSQMTRISGGLYMFVYWDSPVTPKQTEE